MPPLHFPTCARRLQRRANRLLPALTASLWLTAFAATSAGSAAKIVLDVDLAEDVDDAGAVAVLHALADRGEAEILAMLVSSRNEWVVPCLDAINTWYGRPEIPIGYQQEHQYGYRNSKDPGRETPSKYAEAVARDFPHALKRSSDAPGAAVLCRRVLAAQPDHSVTIVSVGFLTNLRSLLDSPPDQHSSLDGEALVRQKVKEWVCMGGIFPSGKFPDGQGEYNLMWDTEASVRAVNDWPTPIVFSGFAIGAGIKVGARLTGTPEGNPVRGCYQHYNGLADREAWDQTAVLCAVRGVSNYWRLSEPGLCLMHARVAHGYNEWIPTPKGQHRFLIEAMAPEAVGKVIEDLMISPPRMANPVIPIQAADPHAAIFGDEYFIYPSFGGAPEDGFCAWSSHDLVHWRNRGVILRFANCEWNPRVNHRAWAPGVAERNGKYYFYFSADSRIGVAVADSPAGSFKDPLGAPLIAYRDDLSAIDPMPFVDDDGQAYLYWGAVPGAWLKGKVEPIRGYLSVRKLNPDMISFAGEELRTIETDPEKGPHIEGSFLLKRKGTYYLMWSPGSWDAGGGPHAYHVRYALAKSPIGPFTAPPDNVILESDYRQKIIGPGHHSVICIPGTDDHYIVYHAHKADADRRIFVDRLCFNTDGTIVKVKPTRKGVAPRPLR